MYEWMSNKISRAKDFHVRLPRFENFNGICKLFTNGDNLREWETYDEYVISGRVNMWFLEFDLFCFFFLVSGIDV